MRSNINGFGSSQQQEQQQQQPQQVQGGAPGPAGGMGGMFSGCFEAIPFVTKLLLGISLLGIVLYFVGLDGTLANCPDLVLSSFQVWRLFSSILVQSGIFNALFSALTLVQYCKIAEYRKGSMYMLHATVVCTLLLNVIYLLLIGPWALSSRASVQSATSAYSGMSGDGGYCSDGTWALALIIMVIETQSAPEESRRFMCFPIDVPTKYYPWIILLFFSILAGIRLDMFLGVIVGYIYMKVSRFQPSAEKLKQWETSPKLSWLVDQNGFIKVDQAAAGNVWNPFVMGGQQAADEEQPADRTGRTFGSGASGSRGNIHTVSEMSRLGRSASGSQSSSSTSGTASGTSGSQSRAFSSAGHRLGSSSSSSRAVARPGAILAEKVAQEQRRAAAAAESTTPSAPPASAVSASSAASSAQAPFTPWQPSASRNSAASATAPSAPPAHQVMDTKSKNQIEDDHADEAEVHINFDADPRDDNLEEGQDENTSLLNPSSSDSSK